MADAAERGARLVVLPELVLTGYPVEDLALRPSFQQASRDAVQELAATLQADGHGDITCLIGYLDYLDDDGPLTAGRPRRAPVNAAAVVRDGTVLARYLKHHLPNYGVFDEARYFVPGDAPLVVRRGRRRGGDRHLRGPLAGRWTGRLDPRVGHARARRAQRLPLRA